MIFIAYAFKGQVQVFAGPVKIVSHSSCRTSAILKYQTYWLRMLLIEHYEYFLYCLYYLGTNVRKPVFGVLRTTKAQISLPHLPIGKFHI